ncbi:GNAT family N-acetyltransferase [Paenibacillus alkalitolerans]|uniref:GNAT family N-acetyltransferase n=1 Tax=Paenibacillus alkalitolerans TaxID=2799335 RepID=UPI001F18E96C|nr:GNAT family N-acetyltransferase [Paenibacillus alkalitolerans]
MGIEYYTDRLIEPLQVVEVFRKSGIRRPINDMDRIERMIKNADEVISAWDNGILIGVLRAITDYSYCCFISDIAVDKEYQGRGIGKTLINNLKNKLGNEEIQFVLTSAPIAVEFYEKIGFERADKAFVIKRLKNT